MINQRAIVLDVEKNGRIFQILLPLGAPWADCYEAMSEFDSGIKEMEKSQKEAHEALEAKKKEEESVPQSEPELIP